MMSPITSKKQSQAKADWMKENSKIFSVRVMKNTEADIYNFLMSQKQPTTTIKEAIREYTKTHGETTTLPDKPFWEELDE